MRRQTTVSRTAFRVAFVLLSLVAASTSAQLQKRGSSSFQGLLTQVPSPRLPFELLVDQGPCGTLGAAAQIFPDFNDSRLEAADDFVVAPGEVWTLLEVITPGTFEPPTASPSIGSVSLQVYDNDPATGRPGNLVCDEQGLIPLLGAADPVLDVQLSGSCVLGSGTYWLSILPVMPFDPAGQWFWRETPGGAGSEFMWRDPDELTGPGCSDWHLGNTECGIGLVYPNLCFAVGGTRLPLTSFEATGGLGSIPEPNEGGCAQGGAQPLEIEFDVSGLTGPANHVRVDLGIEHPSVGDLDMTLIGPSSDITGTAQHTVFSRTGATDSNPCGSESDLLTNGTVYSFDDLATGDNFWTSASLTTTTSIPPQAYRTTLPGPQPTESFSPPTVMNAAFATLGNPNGLWTLRIEDLSNGDTGSVSSATLSLGAVCEMLTLTNDVVTDEQMIDWCAAVFLGQNFTIAPTGALTVTSGTVVVHLDGFSVEGTYEAGIDESLNPFPPAPVPAAPMVAEEVRRASVKEIAREKIEGQR